MLARKRQAKARAAPAAPRSRGGAIAPAIRRKGGVDRA